MDNRFYQHSEKSTPINLGIAIVISFIIAILFAYVYNILILIIPIVYVNVFITGIFAAALGYTSKFISRLAKIRNSRHNLVLAALTGFSGFYFQWIAYAAFLNTNSLWFDAYISHFNFIYNPIGFLTAIIEFSKVGSWSMFDVTFRDFPLWIIWTIEAGMIIGFPIFIMIKHPIVPFSEQLDHWYPRYRLTYEFEKITMRIKFNEDLLSNPEATISALTYGAPGRYSEVIIYYLKDEQIQYLSVDNVLLEDRGSKKDIDHVVQLLKIDTTTAELLMKKYGNKKEFALNY
ncbi:MAG: hypothetical protein HOP30_15010 [Cyclobacteriaceae bacterium]|nr:hypothetical protein [Cyclobacteriaceae bacterium]